MIDDMRTLLASDDPHAAEAVDLFVYSIGRMADSNTAINVADAIAKRCLVQSWKGSAQ